MFRGKNYIYLRNLKCWSIFNNSGLKDFIWSLPNATFILECIFTKKYSFKHLPSYLNCNQKGFGSVFSKYANKLTGGILSVYTMPLQSCICESAVTFCNWSRGRTLKGLLVFALLNKYSKVLEIPKSHLCIPVQCIQNICANTALSHVNSKETVFTYQGRNTGPQKIEIILRCSSVLRPIEQCQDGTKPEDFDICRVCSATEVCRAQGFGQSAHFLESSETRIWDVGKYQTETSERANLGSKHITEYCNSNTQTALRKLL